ncbi:hypothetical protein C8Q79DRAFT_1011279 [Trametes meyenii]|nr:hypothetical protein C8Q79DRAFT_1011279 [Trametes meyenii]
MSAVVFQSSSASSTTAGIDSDDTYYLSTSSRVPTWKPPTYQELLEEREYTFTNTQKADAWAAVACTVNSRSDEITKRWNREVDVYLIIAGLSSALLMVSNMHSYQLLQPPTADPAVLALERISAQLSSFTSNPPFINSTQPAFQNLASTVPISPIPRPAIWLNGLWFSSLILTLSATFIGILVKQWFDAYHSNMASSDRARETLRLRQYRFNNLVRWNVGTVIAVIPVLLHTALSLFLAGLLVLLYTVHEGIASAVAALIGVLAAFVLVTVLLPLFKEGCSYITPATHVLYALYPSICGILGILSCVIFCVPAAITYVLTRMPNPIGHAAGLAWFPVGIVPLKLFKAGAGRGQPTFRMWEKWCVGVRRNALDADAIVMACETTPGTSTMDNAIMCLSDTRPVTVISVFERMYGERYKTALWFFDFDCTTARTLWIDCLLCLADRDVRHARRQKVLPELSKRLLTHARTIESCDDETKRAQVEDALLVFSALALDSTLWKQLGPLELAAQSFWALCSKVESVAQAGQPAPLAGGVSTVKTNQALLNYAKAAESVASAARTASQLRGALQSASPSANRFVQAVVPHIWATAHALPQIAVVFNSVPGLEVRDRAHELVRAMLDPTLSGLVSAGDWKRETMRLPGGLGVRTYQCLNQIVDTLYSNDALFSGVVPDGFYECLRSQGTAASSPESTSTQNSASASRSDGNEPASKPEGPGVATRTDTPLLARLGRIISCSRADETSEPGGSFSSRTFASSSSSARLAGSTPQSDHQPLTEKNGGNDASGTGGNAADEEKPEEDALSFTVTLCPSSEQEVDTMSDSTGLTPEPTTTNSDGPRGISALPDNGHPGTADPGEEVHCEGLPAGTSI